MEPKPYLEKSYLEWCFYLVWKDVDDEVWTILCHIGAFLNSVGGTSSQIDYKQRQCHCCRVTICYWIGYRSEILDGFLLSMVTWPSPAILEPFLTLWEGRVHKSKQRRCLCCRVTIGYWSEILDGFLLSMVNWLPSPYRSLSQLCGRDESMKRL